MRIAHVTDFYLPRLGGIEMHVSDLAQRQAAQGHDVTVLSSSPAAGQADTGPVRVVRLTDHLRRPHALHPRAPFAGARHLLDGDFDVVHVHVGVCSPLGFWAALAAARRGVPVLVTVHSLWSQVRPIFEVLDAVGGWTRRPIQWSAVSEAAARPVRRMVGARHDVAVISNGIDADRWEVEPTPRPDDVVVIVAVMRLAARKRPLPLARMLREVRRRVPEHITIDVQVVGDGPRRQALERHLGRKDMTGWVHLHGRRDREHIQALYHRADVFLAPADLESFGIAALEARCAGVPVVAKRQSGIAEFVTDGEHGLLADSDREMVDALVALCTEPALRRKLHGPGGTETTGWDAVLARTHEAYAEAAGLVGRTLPAPAVHA